MLHSDQDSFKTESQSPDSYDPPPHTYLADIMGATPKTTKHCLLCLEDFSTEDGADYFPHQCAKCQLSNICATCLKDWFIDACRNEAKMTPRCCRIIPLSSISNLLQPAEVSNLPPYLNKVNY